MRPVSDILAVGISEEFLNVRALVTHDSIYLGSSIVDQDAANFLWLTSPHLAVCVGSLAAVNDDKTDGLVRGKVALDADDTNREEASLVEEGLVGSLVNVDGTVRAGGMKQPEMTITDRLI
jgi:hypothetical protein